MTSLQKEVFVFPECGSSGLLRVFSGLLWYHEPA